MGWPTEGSAKVLARETILTEVWIQPSNARYGVCFEPMTNNVTIAKIYG